MSDRYTLSANSLPSADELLALFAQTDWAEERTAAEVGKLLGRIDVCVTVREGGKLVGFGRALSDGICRALVDDIIVDEEHRGHGIGGMIMEELMRQLSGIEEVFLNTGPNLRGFYGRFGLKDFDGLTMVATPREPKTH